jgi:chemotaxis signal transduction protein
MNDEHKFLLFPAGGRDCAIATERVAELTAPSTVHLFPHDSPEIAGVILRHGKVIPLYHLARLLEPQAEAAPEVASSASFAAPPSAAGNMTRYQVIVDRHYAGASERAAFTADGACDLVAAELLPAKVPSKAIAGELEWNGKTYAALDLDKLFALESEA